MTGASQATGMCRLHGNEHAKRVPALGVLRAGVGHG